MDNLRNAIDILFHRRDVKEILRIFHNPVSSPCEQTIELKTFKNLWQETNLLYSGDQLNSLYSVMNDSWVSPGGYKSFFNILEKAAGEMLTFENDDPVCRYEHYLRWHELTALVGEDILTCRHLAETTVAEDVVFRSFAWKPVLTTDNHRLEQIFRRGLSELHFHFRGSSLIFDISWISLMNEPSRYDEKDFKSLPTSESVRDHTVLAALLRLFLFVSVNGYDDSFRQVKDLMRCWLQSPESLGLIGLKDNEIEHLAAAAACQFGRRFSGDTIDYAIPDKLTERDERRCANQSLAGERKLLYDCFRSIREGKEPCACFGSYLYLYLVLKSKFRSCIVQQNRRIGFENFKDFEENKTRFVKRNRLYMELVDSAAANVTLFNQNINYIEYRIAPKGTREELSDSIRKIKNVMSDSRFGGGKQPGAVDYGFVIHFIKKQDDDRCYDGLPASGTLCRNEALRRRLDSETQTVADLVRDPGSEHKIIGVDAANSEFYCRAEVYAKSYRILRSLHHDSSVDYLVGNEFGGLGFTYHAGEDFYDLADGLRSIEEAVIFLGLSIGDRLGHAAAMGVNVRRYYDEKHFTTILPRQNLIDNLAWLLYKSEELGLLNLPVKYFLAEKFDEHCLGVYGKTISPDTYIQSWMLRGDSPECYRKWHDKPTDTLNQYLLRPNADVQRSNEDARILMHRYHFDAEVKYKGKMSIEFRIEKPYQQSFVQLLTAVQRGLQMKIARRKISIETNLTSNRRICDIDKYSSHPIVQFYKEGLVFEGMTEDNHPQISVSINTDDQGIFSTSLEKEYTLMALAMEKWVDSNGKPMVKEYSIYQWLENIRMNSISQRFRR